MAPKRVSSKQPRPPRADLIDALETVWKEARKRGEEPELGSKTTETGSFQTLSSLSGTSLGSWYYSQLANENDRKSRYLDYAQILDDMPEVDAAVDALVDAALQSDNKLHGEAQVGYKVAIASSLGTGAEEAIREAEEATGIQEEISGVAHDMLTYGDDFSEIIATADHGVVQLAYRPPESIRIHRASDGRVDLEFPYVQVDFKGQPFAWFRDWQILHFANRRDRRTLYGRSHLASCRIPITQLRLMEDAAVVGWLHRSLIRYAWFLDVTNLTPSEARVFIDDFKSARTKQQSYDPTTGRYRFDRNPLTQSDDIYLPKGGSNSQTDIKVLQGDPNLRFTSQGLMHFHNKLFAGLKVPKGLIGFAEEIAAKAVLTEQQVQMARTVRRIQLDLKTALRKFYRIVLLARGIDPASVKASFVFPFMGTLDETVRANLKFTNAQVATMLGGVVPPDILARRVLAPALDLSEEDTEVLIQYLDAHPMATGAVPPNGVRSPTAGQPSSDRPGSRGRSGTQRGRARGMNPGHEFDASAVVAAIRADPEMSPLMERLGFLLRWKAQSVLGEPVDLSAKPGEPE